MRETTRNLTEAVSLIDDRYLDLAEKTNEEILEMSKNKRSIVSVRRTMRMLLIAAVLVTLIDKEPAPEIQALFDRASSGETE